MISPFKNPGQVKQNKTNMPEEHTLCFTQCFHFSHGSEHIAAEVKNEKGLRSAMTLDQYYGPLTQ